MKKLVLRNIQVDGRRELDLFGSNIVQIESNNPHDPTAVAVFDGPRKVGNLKREYANFLYEVIAENKAKSKYFLRPLHESQVLSRRIGSKQPCAIAFKIDESDIRCLSAVVEKQIIIHVEVMDLPSK